MSCKKSSIAGYKKIDIFAEIYPAIDLGINKQQEIR